MFDTGRGMTFPRKPESLELEATSFGRPDRIVATRSGSRCPPSRVARWVVGVSSSNCAMRNDGSLAVVIRRANSDDAGGRMPAVAVPSIHRARRPLATRQQKGWLAKLRQKVYVVSRKPCGVSR